MIKLKVTNKKTVLGSVEFTKSKVTSSEELLGKAIAEDVVSQLKMALGSSPQHRGFFRGKLKESIRHEQVGDNQYEIKMNFYGLFLERGTAGSEKEAPPQLVNWVFKKGPMIGLNDKGKPIETREQAKAVANRIRAKGTREYRFIRDTLDKYNPSPEIAAFKNNVEI